MKCTVISHCIIALFMLFKLFFFLIITWNIILSHLSFLIFLSFLQTPLVESKTSTKATAILKALMDKELFEVYLEDEGIT